MRRRPQSVQWRWVRGYSWAFAGLEWEGDSARGRGLPRGLHVPAQLLKLLDPRVDSAQDRAAVQEPRAPETERSDDEEVEDDEARRDRVPHEAGEESGRGMPRRGAPRGHDHDKPACAHRREV